MNVYIDKKSFSKRKKCHNFLDFFSVFYIVIVNRKFVDYKTRSACNYIVKSIKLNFHVLFFFLLSKKNFNINILNLEYLH